MDVDTDTDTDDEVDVLNCVVIVMIPRLLKIYEGMNDSMNG